MYLCYNQATVYLFVSFCNHLPPHQPIMVPPFPLLLLIFSLFLCHLQPFLLSLLVSLVPVCSAHKSSADAPSSRDSPLLCACVCLFVCVCVSLCVSECSLAWHGGNKLVRFHSSAPLPVRSSRQGRACVTHARLNRIASFTVCEFKTTTSTSRASVCLCALYACFCVCASVL